MTERIVVIGADAAGMSAASQAKRMTGDAVEIVAFERGTYSFYAACGIPYWVAGDVDEPSTRLSLILARTRLCTAIARHAVLVMAALAICAVTAALLKDRTGTQAPKPVRPDQPPPAEPGMTPLTVPEIGLLLAAALLRPDPPAHARHWLDWRRRHQARSRWFHQRTRLTRNIEIALVR